MNEDDFDNDYEMQVEDQIKAEDIKYEVVYEAEDSSTKVCQECGEEVSSQKELEKHNNKFHDHREFDCDVCGKSFKGLKRFLDHKRSHTMAQCDICSEFVSKATLSRHVKKHSKEHLHCDQCDYKTLRKDTLREHMATHEDPKFSCDQCPFTSRSQIRLEKHMKKDHKEKKPPVTHKCSWCDFKSRYKTHVSRHEKGCKVMKAATKPSVEVSCSTAKEAYSASGATARQVLLLSPCFLIAF